MVVKRGSTGLNEDLNESIFNTSELNFQLHIFKSIENPLREQGFHLFKQHGNFIVDPIRVR
ncbi:MAG: hypothetical protein ACTSR3_23405 [Candidatus Helarchaeota archaeon]